MHKVPPHVTSPVLDRSVMPRTRETNREIIAFPGRCIPFPINAPDAVER